MSDPRAFVLQRDDDETGVSGTGVVAEGVLFSDGTVALRWTSKWPTSVVFHDRGIEGVEAVHGHGGKTRIVWCDQSGWTVNDEPLTWQQLYEREHEQRLKADRWGVLVSDLDRNEFGRHEGDVDSNVPSGVSQGNPLLPTGTVLGWTLSGRPYVVPDRRQRHDPDAWLPEPTP